MPRRERLELGIDAAPRTVDRSWSRYVRGLKLVLPATAALIVLLVFAWPQIQLQDGGPDPESLRIRPQDAADLTVLGVRYVGTDARDRQFTVTAAATRQANPDAQEVLLEKPEADMDLRDGRRLELSADNGTYDRGRSALALSGGVRFSDGDGLSLSTERASIDFREGEAQGDRPVTVRARDGKASAEGFMMFDNGRRVFLTGKSSLILNQPPGDGS